MTGSTTLRTKLCKAEDDIEESKKKCFHTKDELTKPIPNEPTFTSIGAEVIKHDPSTCDPAFSLLKIFRHQPPACMYNLGILGTAEGKSHYGVTVRHQEGHHLLLIEGSTLEGSAIQGQYNYYKISIHDDTITTLTIQLLTIHGDADLFLSKKDEYPTENKFERKATICGRFPDTIMFTKDTNSNETLVGDYYIGVYGFTESSYHLYYHAERTDKDEHGNTEIIKLPIKMQQNKPIKGIFRSKDDYALYKFNIGKLYFYFFGFLAKPNFFL